MSYAIGTQEDAKEDFTSSESIDDVIEDKKEDPGEPTVSKDAPIPKLDDYNKDGSLKLEVKEVFVEKEQEQPDYLKKEEDLAQDYASSSFNEEELDGDKEQRFFLLYKPENPKEEDTEPEEEPHKSEVLEEVLEELKIDESDLVF